MGDAEMPLPISYTHLLQGVLSALRAISMGECSIYRTTVPAENKQSLRKMQETWRVPSCVYPAHCQSPPSLPPRRGRECPVGRNTCKRDLGGGRGVKTEALPPNNVHPTQVKQALTHGGGSREANPEDPPLCTPLFTLHTNAKFCSRRVLKWSIFKTRNIEGMH